MRFVYGLVAAMVGLYFLFDFISGISDLVSPPWVWVYPIECKGKVLVNLCEGTLGLPMNPSAFVAFRDRQEVIEYLHGPVRRLEGCTVLNGRTWTCFSEFPHGSTTQVMDRGWFTEVFSPPESRPPASFVVYVPAWRYYWYRFFYSYRAPLPASKPLPPPPPDTTR